MRHSNLRLCDVVVGIDPLRQPEHWQHRCKGQSRPKTSWIDGIRILLEVSEVTYNMLSGTRVARSPVFSGSSRISARISRLPDRSQNLPYLTRRSLASEINVLETGKTAQFELPQKPMKLDKTD